MSTIYDLLSQFDGAPVNLNGQGVDSNNHQSIYGDLVPSIYQLQSGIPCLNFQDSIIYPMASHQQVYISPLLHTPPLSGISESPLSYQSDNFNTHLSLGYENNSIMTSPEDDALSLLFDNNNLDFGKHEGYTDQSSDCLSVCSTTSPSFPHISISEDEFYPTTDSPKSLSRSSSVESLYTRDGSSSNYRCEYPNCTKTFTRTYNLKSHRRTHTDERPFGCSMCHKTFARQHDRNRHEKLHGGTKPYLCEFCDKSFARQDALNRHLKKDKRSRDLQQANQPFVLYAENTMSIPPCLLSMIRKRNQEEIKKRAAAKRRAAAAMKK